MHSVGVEEGGSELLGPALLHLQLVYYWEGTRELAQFCAQTERITLAVGYANSTLARPSSLVSGLRLRAPSTSFAVAQTGHTRHLSLRALRGPRPVRSRSAGVMLMAPGTTAQARAASKQAGRKRSAPGEHVGTRDPVEL